MLSRIAYAKINLTLEILNKRDDGYHNIRSVMQKVSLSDTLYFDFFDRGDIFLECDRKVCSAEDNLAYKAAAMFRNKYFNKTGKTFGVHIIINKNIPDKAGLAGGSADCACVLDCLYETFPGIDYVEIESIASKLGSDINFCLDRHKSALCTGRGTEIQDCMPLKDVQILICVPDYGMKTSDIYKAFDNDPIYFKNDPSGMVKDLLNAGRTSEIYSLTVNSFAPICESVCKDIAYIKETMFSQGAHAAQMSGSGSAVYGIFDDDEKMHICFERLSAQYQKCYICGTVI